MRPFPSIGEQRCIKSEAEEHPAFSSLNISRLSDTSPIFEVSLNSNGVAGPDTSYDFDALLELGLDQDELRELQIMARNPV